MDLIRITLKLCEVTLKAIIKVDKYINHYEWACPTQINVPETPYFNITPYYFSIITKADTESHGKDLLFDYVKRVMSRSFWFNWESMKTIPLSDYKKEEYIKIKLLTMEDNKWKQI